jgi:hypothetical protein
MSLGEFIPPRVNTGIQFATADGTPQFVVIDVDPDEFSAAFEAVGRRGLMLLDDRRGGHIWTIWGTMILGADATEAQPDPLPGS